jgi:hypothetical protein
MVRVFSGLGDDGRPLNRLELLMEGRLRSFRGFSDPRLALSPIPETAVSVSVEFATDRQRDYASQPGYIGRIQFKESRANGVEFDANVELALPLSVRQQLNILGRQLVLFTAICDSIDEPTEVQKADHYVALVKRAYFRVPSDE